MKEIKSFLKAVGYAAACYLTYGAILLGMQAVSHCDSPKITSISQLEKLVDVERNRVGISDKVSINLVSDTYPKCEKKSETEYDLRLNLNDLDLSTLRHELFHIKDSQGDSNKRSLFQYLFWDEPRATIYQATGINLAE